MASNSVQDVALDQRHEDYWHDTLVPLGWVAHRSRHAVIGQNLLYALAVITVERTVPHGAFTGQTVPHDAAQAVRVTVDAADLEHCVAPTVDNTRVDDLGEILQLYRHTQPISTGFRDLPVGEYQLEIMVPLFTTQKGHRVVRVSWGQFRVFTRHRVYSSAELQRRPALLGFVSRGPTADRRIVWRYPRAPVNVTVFARRMQASAAAVAQAGDNQEESATSESTLSEGNEAYPPTSREKEGEGSALPASDDEEEANVAGAKKRKRALSYDDSVPWVVRGGVRMRY